MKTDTFEIEINGISFTRVGYLPDVEDGIENWFPVPAYPGCAVCFNAREKEDLEGWIRFFDGESPGVIHCMFEWLLNWDLENAKLYGKYVEAIYKYGYQDFSAFCKKYGLLDDKNFVDFTFDYFPMFNQEEIEISINGVSLLNIDGDYDEIYFDEITECTFILSEVFQEYIEDLSKVVDSIVSSLKIEFFEEKPH